MAGIGYGQYVDDTGLFSGTANQAIIAANWAGTAAYAVKGQPVFYATNSNYNVAEATQANADRFAGVVLARKGSTLQLATSFPGSGCEILVTETVSVGDYVYPIIGGTGFQKAIVGQLGKGAARILTARTGAGITNAELVQDTLGVSAAVESVAFSGATAISQFGTTSIASGASTPTATLAAGQYIGQRKRFISGTVASSVVVTIVNTTAGSFIGLGSTTGTTIAGKDVNSAGGAGTNQLTFATGAATALLEWYGGGWKLLQASGNVTPA